MSAGTRSELEDFNHYVAGLIASGQTTLSPEAAILHWRMENLPPEDRDEEVRAIQEALDDIAAGDQGMPADEFLQEINREFHLPSRP